VPVSDSSKRRPTFLKLASADVLHSFWVPQLAAKTDVILNRNIVMWIEPTESGTYGRKTWHGKAATETRNISRKGAKVKTKSFRTWRLGASKSPSWRVTDDGKILASRENFEQ